MENTMRIKTTLAELRKTELRNRVYFRPNSGARVAMMRYTVCAQTGKLVQKNFGK